MFKQKRRYKNAQIYRLFAVFAFVNASYANPIDHINPTLDSEFLFGSVVGDSDPVFFEPSTVNIKHLNSKGEKCKKNYLTQSRNF
jgi:hypothetical protein